jgi:hypothetical protein
VSQEATTVKIAAAVAVQVPVAAARVTTTASGQASLGVVKAWE